ncbi:MAG: c-type cytochrome domain-containing protein, partial [Pirellulaceae bacterium]
MLPRVLLAAWFIVFTGTTLQVSGQLVDYARDVAPILTNHCWSCHGPDPTARQADLRLDLRDAAIAAQ